MPRSRNIKPGFFANENLADCEPMARLLFINLWMLADREGRLENRPKKIKVQTFPYDDCDIADLIGQLEREGFIFSYEAQGVAVMQINNWSKHQNPHHKEVASELPIYDKSKHKLITPQAQVKHDSNTVCDGYIPLSNTIRKRIFDRDGHICGYCGSEEKPEIDHIIPVTKGGNSVDDNLQVLCSSCNGIKYNHLVNQALSIKHGRPILESTLNQDCVNESASCSTDSLNLIPDSCSLIPDGQAPLGELGAAKNSLYPAPKLSDRDRELAIKYWKTKDREDLIPNVEEIFLQLVNNYKAKGKALADWSAAWQNWYINQPKFERAPNETSKRVVKKSRSDQTADDESRYLQSIGL